MKKLLLIALMLCSTAVSWGQNILISPKNDSAYAPTKLGLQWTHQLNIKSYYIQTDTSSNFNSALFKNQSSHNSSGSTMVGAILNDTISNLKYGMTYYWRVKMLNINNVDSSYSETNKITTFSKPKLVGPINGASNVSLMGDMFFESKIGAIQYHYQVGTTNVFTSPIYNTTLPIGYVFKEMENISVHLPDTLNSNTLYYWHIKEINAVDSSDWSETWSFTTEKANQVIDLNNLNDITIYPNPASTEVSIEFTNDLRSIELVDLSGKTIYSSASSTRKYLINTYNYAAGMYYIKVNTIEGGSKIFKLMIAF